MADFMTDPVLIAAVIAGIVAVAIFVAGQTYVPWVERTRQKKQSLSDLISEIQQNKQHMQVSTYITLEDESFKRFRQTGFLGEQTVETQNDLRGLYSRIHEKNELVQHYFMFLTGPKEGRLVITGGDGNMKPLEEVIAGIRAEAERLIDSLLPKLIALSAARGNSGGIATPAAETPNRKAKLDDTIRLLIVVMSILYTTAYGIETKSNPSSSGLFAFPVVAIALYAFANLATGSKELLGKNIGIYFMTYSIGQLLLIPIFSSPSSLLDFRKYFLSAAVVMILAAFFSVLSVRYVNGNFRLFRTRPGWTILFFELLLSGSVAFILILESQLLI